MEDAELRIQQALRVSEAVRPILASELPQRVTESPDKTEGAIALVLAEDLVSSTTMWIAANFAASGFIAKEDAIEAASLAVNDWKNRLANEMRARSSNPN